MTADRTLTVLVTGATGTVVRRLVRYLLDDGHHVRALTRCPATAGLPAEVDLRPGHPAQPDAVAEAARGADATFWNWMGFDGAGASESVSAVAREVEHIVYLSAAQLQHGTRGVMPGVWADLEQAITATGTDWTFLRAAGSPRTRTGHAARPYARWAADHREDFAPRRDRGQRGKDDSQDVNPSSRRADVDAGGRARPLR